MILTGLALIAYSVLQAADQARRAPTPFDIAETTDSQLSLPALTNPETPITNTGETAPTPSAGISPVSNYATPQPATFSGEIPDRIIIPSINVDAPVIPMEVRTIQFNGSNYTQWDTPNEYAVGWHRTSALLGLPGNTVLNGHHNVYGEVFGSLVQLRSGALIELYSGDHIYKYIVAETLLIPERFRPLQERMSNSGWIAQTRDERITLITCWPKESNTHRVIVIAYPENIGQ